MTLYELLKRTRTRLRDKAKGILWTDEEIVDWLNEGVQKFAKDTFWFLEDDRGIELADGDEVMALDEDVLYVNKVSLNGIMGELGCATNGRIPAYQTKSQPTHFAMNAKTQTIRFYPAADSAYTAVLNVARKPEKLSLDNLNAEVELPDEYSLVPVDWAMARCLQDNDVDGINEASADKAERRFYQRVNEAKLQFYRLRTGPKARAHGDRVK